MRGRGRISSWYGVGVGGGFLDVAKRDARVEGGGDERVAQGVRPDLLGESGAFGDAAEDPSGSVPVKALFGGGEEDGSVAAFADGEVDRPCGTRCEGDDGFLAALAGDGQGPVAALGGQVLDVRAGSF
jgi:hypothetical protein